VARARVGSSADAGQVRAARLTETFAALGGEIDAALEDLRVPAFVVDRGARIRYQNRSARELFGNANGRVFFDLLAPESRAAAHMHFNRKLLGTERTSDTERWVPTPQGDALVELHSVAIEAGERVVGVFGIASSTPKLRPRRRRLALPSLTPRQTEVLDRLAEGMSTEQIAGSLGISRETVRNHVRGILRTLGVHSRLEAIVEARRRGLLAD
jgi:PAS domain S-box-containing protein